MRDQNQHIGYRVGDFPSETLRRALEDARVESDRPRITPNRRNQERPVQQESLFEPSVPRLSIPSQSASRQPSNRSASGHYTSPYRVAAEATAAEGAAAEGAAAEGAPLPREPWHERLIQRFFSVPPPVDPLKKNGRLYFALLMFLLAFSLVLVRLFKVQVLDHDAFSAQASSQYKMQQAIPAKRGVIRDRNGVILASNAYVVKFAVDPLAIKDKTKLASALAAVFHKPAAAYLKTFADTSRHYIVIEREVPIEVASALDSIKERGLIREVESRRSYAFDDRASHILGFSSRDGRGLAGVELAYNRALGGKDGFVIMQRDGRGMRRPDVDYEQVNPVDGDDVTLTIDEAIQSTVESALRNGVETAKAEAGIAIVMNPKTGEILSMANYPDFNVNDAFRSNPEQLRNRAITDAFEPGSTIKVLTAAMALEEGVLKPNDKLDAEGGTWVIDGGAKIRDTHPHHLLTFRQALELSSNVCFAKISDLIGKKRFYKYLRDFGFGVYSDIELPGEIKGYVRKPDTWGPNSKRYMGFGYEITNTCLQMAAAYSAIANYGIMMKPYVVAKRTHPDGEEERTVPQEIRRVVSEATCRTLIGMMRGVVDSGTATSVKIKGVAIAGKTGTAQQLVDGHYSKEFYTSSFTGFFPAENPEYLVLVVLRSPRNGYYGGTVSGPIFREIAMKILDMKGELPPEARIKTAASSAVLSEVDEMPTDLERISSGPLPQSGTDETRELPDVRGLTLDAGRTLLLSQGYIVKVVGGPQGAIDRIERISSQNGGDTVRIVVAAPTASAKVIKAPNFVGMPIARASKFGAMNGIRIKIVGDGNVRKQFPLPDAPLDAESPLVTLFGEE